MARATTPLTNTKIKNAKSKDKDYKLFDGGGLFLLITKRGTKLWRLKYKQDLANGINPSEDKKQKIVTKKKEEINNLNTFKLIVLERLEKQKDDISQSHYKRTFNGFINDVFPIIGDIPIDEVTAKHIINILQIMNDRDANSSARKVYHSINTTFKYAVANARAKRNPAQDIAVSEILGKEKKKHYPTITDDKGIRNLLISIKEYQGELSTKYALLILAYTFVRPSNIRLALWDEIDFNSKQWVIPAKKMKTKDEFIIPLSTTVIKLLNDIKPYSSDSPYLFPSTKSKTTPLSDGALLGAIRRMGYTTNEFTPHGFRAMFSTIAHEKSSFKYDVIETQLAHSVGNAVSQAYNRAKYLDERVELMQWWSNYLDEV